MAESTGEATPMGAVVGRNLALQRNRARLTQRQAAAVLREHGLNWSAGNLAQLESGRRRSVRLEELVLMSAAFNVDLIIWLQPAPSEKREKVELAEGVSIALTDLGRFLTRLGSPLTIYVRRGEADTDPVRVAAARLLVTPDAVDELARSLWGRSFLEERDARVGEVSGADPRTVQAWRGHASRTLIGELRARLEGERSS